MKELDFEGLARSLLNQSRNLVPTWLPGGKLIGHEYVCGSIRGGPGDSFRVNLNNGKWAEFAGNDRGGDLISLYAAINGIGQGDAAKQLASHVGHELSQPPAPTQKRTALAPTMPPKNAPVPEMRHGKFGAPSMSWAYRDAAGDVVFYVARYEAPEGKQILPWSWMDGRWAQKGWTAPRPLYGLDDLAARPTAPVLIVEGEKAAEAAKVIAGKVYVVTTWPNGALAVKKADWSPLHRRKVLIWPDADEAGRRAANEIATLLEPDCPEVKIIDPHSLAETYGLGADAADVVDHGWDWQKFVAWAKPRAQVFKPELTATTVAAAGDKQNLAVAAVQTNIQVNTAEDPGEIDGSLFALWEKLGVPCTNSGAPICNVDAALRVLDGMPEFRDFLWFDEFHQRYFTTWKCERGTQREWSKADTLDLLIWLQRRLGLRRMSKDTVNDAVTAYGQSRKRNEPRDWMDSLKWDGQERIDTSFIEIFEADVNDYTCSVSRNFWIGLAARIYRPGCQLDNMVVLEGVQGVGKTRSLRAIGGNWYTEANESVTSKDFFLALHGKMLVEIAELDSFNRADVTRIKQIVTCTNDRYRAPYDEKPQDHPRMCVFVGTTNESTWQRDQTGARRFWPIKCRTANYDMIVQNRDQYFAEAVYRFKAGATWHETPLAITQAEQESRRQTDEWEAIIGDWLIGKSEVMVKDIGIDCLGIEKGRLDYNVQRRIGNVLRTIGWEKRDQRVNGRTLKVWADKSALSLQTHQLGD